MSLVISGATIIDATGTNPIEGHSIWIEGRRIRAIGCHDELGVPAAAAARIIDARGKYVIPGLMNANVHLFGLPSLDCVARYSGRYEELIAEAAQVALKNGLTTVFDTWGPRRFLMNVRDRINDGELPGSRLFCAGNIVGFDGPFSQDFFPKVSEVASATLVRRTNAIWAENVGRYLMWPPPHRVAEEVRTYIHKGIDFVKYASNDHYPGSFLVFSQQVQEAVVQEAHRAGITAQAHTMTVEGLRIAVCAGCDLIQHANVTGPTPIPETTLELMAQRNTGAVVFAWTEAGFDWIRENVSDTERTVRQASDINTRNLIRSGAPLLLANDGFILTPEMAADPQWGKGVIGAPRELCPYDLSRGHFIWLKAMEEKGCAPMEILKAATRNIAAAYGKDEDLGTIEVGKVADLLILNKSPLQAAENYESIHMIIKDGITVDRDILPLNPLLTRPVELPLEEEAFYVPFLSGAQCPACRRGTRQ